MASNLRVDQILPTTGTNIGIGTAGGNIIVGGATTEVVVNGGLHVTGNVQGGTASFLNISAGFFNGFHVDGGAPASSLTVDNLGNTVVGSGHSLYINNGNLVFSTAGTGIDFSATADGSGTVSSEILDDYEEGTWTPIIKSGTNTITATGNNQVYTYTKVGRKVTVYFAMDGATTSGTTGGHFKIEGLPYAMNGPTGNRTMGSVLMFYGSGLRAANWPVWIHLNSNSSILDIYEKSATANNYDRTTVGQVGAASYVFGQITYDAA